MAGFGSQFDNVWVPTLQGAFLTKYEGVLNSTWAYPITRRYDVPGEFLKVVDAGSVGAVRQFTGPRQATKPNAYTLTQQNLPYEMTMEITVEDVRRDKLGFFETKAGEMGAKFADHVNKLVISNITSNPTCFDGTAFFGTNHSISANVNDLSSTQLATLGITNPAAPTPVEMSNALLDAVTWFYTMLDEASDPINGGAKQFLVVTSNPYIYASTLAAITSMQLSQGQTNPLWAGLEAKGYKFLADIDPRLGAQNSQVFYVFRVDSEVKPFVWGEESPLEINYLGEGTYNAVKYNEYIWAAKAVRSVGVGRYQHAIRATFSSGSMLPEPIVINKPDGGVVKPLPKPEPKPEPAKPAEPEKKAEEKK